MQQSGGVALHIGWPQPVPPDVCLDSYGHKMQTQEELTVSEVMVRRQCHYNFLRGCFCV